MDRVDGNAIMHLIVPIKGATFVVFVYMHRCFFPLESILFEAIVIIVSICLFYS